MKKIYLYPFWLRFWHVLNALLCIVLIVSAVSLRYSTTGNLIFSKNFSIYAHNISGVLLTLIYLYYLIYTIATKNYKQYLVGFKGISRKLIVQLQYYALGIFAKKENHLSQQKKENSITYREFLIFLLCLFSCQ